MKTTMKKSVAKVITMALVLMMMLSLAVPAMATSTHNQSTLDAMNAVVQIDVVFVDPELGVEQWITGGTGFFINEDTLITCHHVVEGFTDEDYAEWTQITNAALGLQRSAKEVKENMELRVAVLRDVTVRATIKKVSAEMDFAILTLDEKIYNRTTLPIRKSSDLKQTETIYALGFPSIVSGADDEEYNDASDVTSSTGNVNKITRTSFVTFDGRHYTNVDVVEHGARISAGYSGGPLVDADGNVVGVNAVGNDVGSINMAISMDPIMQTLDALGIKYDSAASAPVETQPAATEAPAPAATEAPAPAVTEAPVVETQPPHVHAYTEGKCQCGEVCTHPSVANNVCSTCGVKVGGGINMTVILIVAAVAVVAVIVVIIIVMNNGKKKQQQPAYSAPTGGFTPAAPTYTAPMGAGETTILGGDAGATTVLSRGGSLIRKRTNETIVINAERFIIGRERKTANYCVADNSSVSRSHVTLITRGGAVYLMDMNAANGTFVNGVKVMANQEIALKNGDKIKLADEEFEFRA